MSDILQKLKEIADGKVDAFLLVVQEDGVSLPQLIPIDEMDQIDHKELSDLRYPLVKIVEEIQERFPNARIGLLVRGCEYRALIELSKYSQINLDKLVLVGRACERNTVEKCACLYPYPYGLENVVGEENPGIEADPKLVEIEGLDVSEKLRYWASQFEKCIKCYGCRNICPLCYCKECSLENPGLVVPGEVPPTLPAFHFLRALDMAGRCVECGLCEEVCPAGIPLRSLYRALNKIMEDQFGYKPGHNLDERSPFIFLGETSDVEHLI